MPMAASHGGTAQDALFGCEPGAAPGAAGRRSFPGPGGNVCRTAEKVARAIQRAADAAGVVVRRFHRWRRPGPMVSQCPGNGMARGLIQRRGGRQCLVRRRAEEVRNRVGGDQRFAGPAMVEVRVAGVDDRLCHGFAAMAAHGLLFSVDRNEEPDAAGHRQPAMKALDQRITRLSPLRYPAPTGRQGSG